MAFYRYFCFLVIALSISAQTLPQVQINAPYVPTPEPVVDAMLKLANVNGNDVVYDLGCGDGRIVVSAAKTYGAHGVGVDLNPMRVDEARANAQRAGVEEMTRFEEGDLFQADIRNATVVTLYLLPDMNARLQPKLLSELKPGTRVITHAFGFPNWKPEKQAVINSTSIYLWIVPQR